MFCAECGAENDKDVQFCASCGSKMPVKNEDGSIKSVYYTYGWPRAKALAIAVVPQFDLMADENNFYVLRLPPSYAPVWGFLIGLIVLKLIGMLIGAAIGEAIANAKRKSARATWINENNHLLSKQYEKYIFLKIPLKDLKHHLSFEKGKYLVIKYNEGTLTLRGSKKECQDFKHHFKEYVL